jgi:CDP-diacylglycerol--glycerol-3-phosphate 3-phosphatidyltransferase/cardiolipin synthase
MVASVGNPVYFWLMERVRFFNLPNSISLSRLLLAIAFVLIDGPLERVILIAAAGTTDFLDGWVARWAKSASVAGALIDPIADRLFVLAAVSSYLFEGKLTTGQYFIFLARDIGTAVGFIVARFIPGLSAASFRARFLGKAVTVLQLMTLLAVLVTPRYVHTLILMIGAFSALSIVDYTAALERARRAAFRPRKREQTTGGE